MKKKRNILIIIVSVVVLFLILGLVFRNNKNINLEINEFMIGDKVYTLKSGDTIFVSRYRDANEYKNKTYDEEIVLFNGVSLGTKFKNVVKLFDLKSGYANLNMEVPTEEGDGTTDIVNELYEDFNSIRGDFLDCYITFGYKNRNGKWEMVEYINIDSADIIFGIDIDGFSSYNYKNCDVAEIDVEYVK